MKLVVAIFIFLFCSNLILADEKNSNTFSFGVVPQQEAKKIRRIWLPLIKRLSRETGLNIELQSARDIGAFQSKMLAGQYDIAYSNPLLYIIANSSIGYRAIAKEKNKKLQGILVVRKDSGIKSIRDLAGKKLVFPQHAFAATVLTQSYLNRQGIRYDASFVFSHDAAYKFTSLGKYAAAGGVMRTFNTLDSVNRSRLKVLKKFNGVTPHAFSVHPRLSEDVVSKIKQSLNVLGNDAEGKLILKRLQMNTLEPAKNSDWNDVRKVMSSRIGL